jgi:hypothetical protein
LVSRDHEVLDASRLLAEGSRFVALVGPSGVGTSAVLRAVVARRPGGPGKVTLVPCRGVASLDELLRRIADALGLPAPRNESRFALRSLLGGALDAGPHLLALDDLPGVEGVDVVVLDWLAVASELRVLVACASPPGGAEVVAVRPLAPAEARSFLIGALARRRPSRPVDDRHLDSWLRHAGGLPIALEVVAARIAMLGELPGPSDAWPELVQTLRRSLAALSPQASRVASDLAVLRGPFSLRAARAVAEVEDTDGAIEALCHASLLELLPGPGEPRLRLLDALRDALTPSDEARGRHARFFAALPVVDPGDLADLLAAFDWLAGRQPDEASEVAMLLDTVLVRTGPFSLHVEVLQRARGLPVAVGRRARVHRLLGRLLAMHGQAEEAIRVNEEGVRLCEAEGGGAPLGWALSFLCYSARVAGRIAQAREVGLRAVAIGEESSDELLISMALQAVGLIDQDEDDHAAALARFVLAEAHGRRARQPRMVAICAANHAMSCIALKNGPAARQSVERACALFASAGDRFHLSRMAWMEAAVLRLNGDLVAAHRHITAALAVFAENGDEAGELEAAIEALVIARAQGDGARIEALSADIQILADRVDEASVVQRARRALRPVEIGAASQTHSLRLLRGGDKLREVWLDGEPLELGRRGPLRGILLALGEAPGRSFSVPELLAIGWPGERMTAESGNARVYMTMRRLRAFGLQGLLVTDDVGYKIHESIQVVIETKLGTVRFPGRACGAQVVHATSQAPPCAHLRFGCRLHGCPGCFLLRLWRG